MTTRVIYRVDAHEYDVRTGTCRTDCPACTHEAVLYPTADDAWAAQPADEVGRFLGGDPRFEIVAMEHF